MKTFSIPQVAFSGFGLIKRQPMLIVVLAIFSLVLQTGMTALSVQMIGPALAQLSDMRTSGEMDPNLAMQLTGRTLPFSLLAMIVSLVVWSVGVAAVNRAVLRPGKSRAPYIGFGGDEWRMFLTALVIGVFVVLIYFVGALIMGIGVAVTAVTTGGGREAMAQGGSPGGAVAIVLAAGICMIVAAIFLFLIKFSLAPSQTVDEKGVRIFGSWGLTKGNYWKIAGTLILCGLMALPLIAVAVGVRVAAGLQAAEGLQGNPMQMMQAMQPDMSSFASAFSTTSLLAMVVLSLATAFARVITTSALANIYRSVADDATLRAFDDEDDDDDDD